MTLQRDLPGKVVPKKLHGELPESFVSSSVFGTMIRLFADYKTTAQAVEPLKIRLRALDAVFNRRQTASC